MLRSNKFNFIIAIISAIAIWVYVIVVVNPTTTRTLENIPFEISGTEELASRDLVIASLSTEVAKVIIEGGRSEVYKIQATDITARIDVTGFKLGENEISINLTGPNNIRIVESRPERVLIKIKKRYTRLEPVVPSITNASTDMEETNVKLLPYSVEISGTKEEIARVSKVVAYITPEDDKAGKHEATIYPTALDKKGRIVVGIKFSQEEILATYEMYYRKEVKLNLALLGSPSPGYVAPNIAAPATVWIKAKNKDSLSEINEINTDTIDVSDIHSDTEIPITLNLPSGIELSSKSKGLRVSISTSG